MSATVDLPGRQTSTGIRRFLEKNEEAIAGILFFLPTALLVGTFTVFPVFFSFYLSFVNWDYISSDQIWVGLGNFRRILAGREFWQALQNTAYYALTSVPLGIACSLGLALLVNRKLAGVTLFRTAYFSPVVTSTVAVAVVWGWLYAPGFGLINYLLSLVGIPGPNWLGDPLTAMPALVIMAVWHGAGYNMVIFLAGLQGIPQDYYDAASVDGANRWQAFRNITWPLLSPSTFFVLVMGVIGSLQMFDSVFVLTKGGPMGTTRSIVYLLFERAFTYFEMGYASAIAYLLFLIIFILTLINWRVGSRFVHYQ